MKKIPFFIIFLLIPISSFTATQEKLIRVGIFNYPPITMDNKDDYGYCYKIIKEIFEPQGYKIQVSIAPVIRTIISVQNNVLDAMCAANQDIAKAYDFKTSIFANSRAKLSFWVKYNSKFSYTGMKSLENINMVFINGYDYNSSSKEFHKYITTHNKVKKLTGAKAVDRAFKMISLERADSICLDEPHVDYILKKAGTRKKFKSAGNLSKAIYGYFSVGKNNPRVDEILKVYNQGHIKLHESGRMKDILKEYGLKPWPLSEGQI